MSIYIRPFKKEDYSAFKPIECLADSEIEDTELAQAIEDSELAVTGVKDGKVIGCGGVHPVEDSDSGELWLRLSPEYKYKPETVRCVRDGLKIIEETYPFTRLNVSVKCRFKKSIKLLESFGFVLMHEVNFNNEDCAVLTKEANANCNRRKTVISQSVV